MTQKHTYRAEIGSNWKLFIDAFMEFYHAPVLHAKQAESEESRKLQSYGFEALAYDIDGPHSMVSSWGGMAPPKDLGMVKPIERALRSGLFGPWEGPDIGELPDGLNPAKHPAWGEDSFLFFPNFMLLIWKPNWYLTYHYWPTSYNTHIFECSLYFAPPKNAYERIQQELAVVTFKEYGLQDGNTLEATQTMIESRAITEFPLCDQEVMLRHLHTTCRELRRRLPGRRDEHSRCRLGCVLTRRTDMPTLPAQFADLEPFTDWCLPSEADRYAKRIASTMDELQAFYDAAFPMLESSAEYLKGVSSMASPRRTATCTWLFCSLVTVSFPVEVWRQPRVPDSGASSIDVTVEPGP